MERVRIGMIGSQFAARLHLQSLAKLRGVKADVVAVALNGWFLRGEKGEHPRSTG